MELEFCQHCGGHTLVRVSISINASGNVQLKQSNRQVFWKRGTVVRIPVSRSTLEHHFVEFCFVDFCAQSWTLILQTFSHCFFSARVISSLPLRVLAPQYSIPKSKYGQMPMLLREDQLQVGRMRQLQNNKRRAEKKASRALFGDVAGSAVASHSAAGSGRAPAAAATRSLVEASAFAAEKVVARTEEIEFGFGRRNPNAQRGGGKRR